jgi:NAD(P)-dependent dehydrogenase (short-subunit alcohol dehydrogenase family)
MKTVIVTGAGSGIGAACAQHLAREGWRLALFDANAQGLEETRAMIGAASHSAALDVTDEAAVASAIDAASALGPIKGLVNCAGIAADVPFLETNAERFRKILDVNVVGSFLVAQYAARKMIAAGGGAIVNIASVSGMVGNVGRTAYGASKGAVITMTQVMATELARAGVRVNAVSPGPVDTAMVQAMHTDAERETWLSRVPMKRYASPQEIAEPIAFLLSDAARFITGQVLVADGGFLSAGTARASAR